MKCVVSRCFRSNNAEVVRIAAALLCVGLFSIFACAEDYAELRNIVDASVGRQGNHAKVDYTITMEWSVEVGGVSVPQMQRAWRVRSDRASETMNVAMVAKEYDVVSLLAGGDSKGRLAAMIYLVDAEGGIVSQPGSGTSVIGEGFNEFSSRLGIPNI